MKVLTFIRAKERRAGMLVDNMVYDIQACSEYLETGRMPSDLLEIVAAVEPALLRDIHARLEDMRSKGDDPPLRCWAALDEVRLAAPIPRPGKVICLGRNYRDHIEEQGAKPPEKPLLFSKATSSVIAPGEAIVIPRGSTQVDFEGELALVIGRRTRRASIENAADAVFGYTCLNDVTEREAQFSEKQWFRGKSMDTFAPMGPWIVTADEIGDPTDLDLTTTVNSRVMQSSSTRYLIFRPEDIIAFASSTITLEPGDIVSTGTPGGVGVFRDPRVFLKAGDTVEITIDKIGTLSNPVVDET